MRKKLRKPAATALSARGSLAEEKQGWLRSLEQFSGTTEFCKIT